MCTADKINVQLRCTFGRTTDVPGISTSKQKNKENEIKGNM